MKSWGCLHNKAEHADVLNCAFFVYGRCAHSNIKKAQPKTLVSAQLAKKMNNVLIIFCCILSWMICGVGLISPLTPSEGIPSTFDLFFFFGVPILILGYCWYKCSSFWTKALIVIQSAVIISFTCWLLSLQLGLFIDSS